MGLSDKVIGDRILDWIFMEFLQISIAVTEEEGAIREQIRRCGKLLKGADPRRINWDEFNEAVSRASTSLKGYNSWFNDYLGKRLGTIKADERAMLGYGPK